MQRMLCKGLTRVRYLLFPFFAAYLVESVWRKECVRGRRQGRRQGRSQGRHQGRSRRRSDKRFMRSKGGKSRVPPYKCQSHAVRVRKARVSLDHQEGTGDQVCNRWEWSCDQWLWVAHSHSSGPFRSCFQSAQHALSLRKGIERRIGGRRHSDSGGALAFDCFT